MILIDAIVTDGNMAPLRELTPEERSTVIGMWFFNNTYRYYQEEDRAELQAREEAQRLIDADILSAQLRASSLSLITQLMQQDPENYMENYIGTRYPDQDIFNL